MVLKSKTVQNIDPKSFSRVCFPESLHTTLVLYSQRNSQAMNILRTQAMNILQTQAMNILQTQNQISSFEANELMNSS